ncbi:MAG: DUF4118 domain-containing protein [Magnetococcales bacterium]|nr:DUF4118 domain-containing protein [Magnetococcales bacterium]
MNETPPTSRNREAILVCVGPGPDNERVVRLAARRASASGVAWHAILVETDTMRKITQRDRERIDGILRLAGELGAHVVRIRSQDAVRAIIAHARENDLGIVLMGRDRYRRLPWQHGFAEKLARLAPDLELRQIAREDDAPMTMSIVPFTFFSISFLDWRAGLPSVPIIALVTAGGWLLRPYLDPVNIVMLFLLTVVYAAIRMGREAAIWAALLAVASFDYFFVPPPMAFLVKEAQYLVTLGVMLTVALVIGQLTAGLRYQVTVAQQREQRLQSLYRMSRAMASALEVERIVAICHDFFRHGFHARVAVLLPAGEAQLALAPGSPPLPGIDFALARQCFEEQRSMGLASNTPPSRNDALYLPLRATTRMCGVMTLLPDEENREIQPEQWRLLETSATLIAIALERVHYVALAREAQSEGLRNSLLSAISHDLRTPLTVITGLVDAMSMAAPELPQPQAGLLTAVREQVARTNTMVNNLLEMARMQMGQVVLHREWQPLEEVVGVSRGQCAFLLARHQVVIDLPPDLPLLELDDALMERVFNNLLENAAKHTPPGSRITLSAWQEGEFVRVAVRDNGPGLPPGLEKKLFEKFTRGSKESAVAGFGLGLAIVRFIVEAHGGTVWAENQADGGAGFHLRLPVGNPPALPEEPVDD